ncbi:MAG: substrate-binding domain-containing protein, partial [Planctomycetota bacterium]|nr:substrate-binding domain-containing protein [Planctomycetota bacterium]
MDGAANGFPAGGAASAIALLLPEQQLAGPPSPYWTAVIASAMRAAAMNRRTLVLASSDRIFSSWAPDRPPFDVPVGGALITTPLVGVPVANFLSRLPIPFVTIGRIGGQSPSYVDCDHSGGTAEAVRELYRLGHRRIVHLSGPPVSYAALLRIEGFRNAMAELGLDCPPEAIVEGNFLPASGEAAAAKVAAMSPRPTAVMCGNDESAVGLMRGLARLGIPVPEDISVIGFDDIPLAASLRPSLSTVR